MHPTLLMITAATRTARYVFALTLFVGLLASAAVFAQDAVNPAAPPASATPTSIVGWVLVGALSLLMVALAWVATQVTVFLKAKTEQTKVGTMQSTGWSLLNKIWLKAQAIGARVASKEKPLMEAILSDGKVTHEEFTQLKDAISKDLMAEIVADVPGMNALLGIVGQGQVANFIDGLAAKVATNMITGKENPPTPSPEAKKPSLVPSPK